MKVARVGEMTPDEARGEARQILAAVRRGEDPAADRTAKRNGATVSDLLDTYLREHVAKKNKPKTQREVERLVKKLIRPKLGSLKVSDLSLDDVKKFHDNLSQTPRQANVALAFLQKALSLVEGKLRPIGSNPCKLVQRFPEVERQRILNAEEMQRLRRALDRAQEDGIEPRAALDAFRLLALTGCRLSEILTLRWAQVDFGAGILHLGTTKSGEPRLHPFGSRTAAFMKAMDRAEDTKYVIPQPTDPKLPMRIDVAENVWRRIRKAAELEDVRIHDLRHGVGTHAAGIGASATDVRDLLGHQGIGMTARYIHRHGGRLRELADRVEAGIGKDLMGWTAEVVPLKQSKD
jgi:integrase